MRPDRGIIIVSGSNGRIGDAVMRRFAGRFQDVVGFDRKAPQPPPPGCVVVPVEITSNESVREGLRAIREAVVLHVDVVQVLICDVRRRRWGSHHHERMKTIKET